MERRKNMTSQVFNSNLISEQLKTLSSFHPFFEYAIDRSQRVSIIGNLLRKQSSLFFKDLKNNQPPVISFKYEIIMDGRKLDKPVNYALTKIIERRGDIKRKKDAQEKVEREKRSLAERRNSELAHLASSDESNKRPIIIIDPRSGSAPGIAGSKKNSEIGMALQAGHPVYYIIFFPKPEKGQTLEDVKNAEVKFIEEVRRLHPDAPRPSVIGNSQAGWALAMLSAEEPDLAGPLILNGSPISYWAGVEGKHVMRYRTGIMGGSWFVSFLSDLGNGYFDGAHLVTGYEAVDPANTFFRQPYKLFSNVDKKHSSYLKFERWWNSYYMMTEEEINFIVNKLFIENSLEKGEVGFKDGKKIDLKDLKDPIVLFSSGADNISPPQQALNWVTKVWGSEEEIKKQDQVIIYLLHENIRHMGIFISDRIAVKEHKGIIESVDKVGYLSPGLYEMIIEKNDPRYTEKEYDIRFEERTFEDIKNLDDSDNDELSFYPAVSVSWWNDRLYTRTLRPVVRTMVNRWNAPFLKMHHPQRTVRYIFSDMNPLMYFFKIWGHQAKKNRIQCSRENPFVVCEEKAVDFIGSCLDFQRDLRDSWQEYFFRQMYGNPFVRAMFPPNPGKKEQKDVSSFQLSDRFKKFKGGFEEAVIRMMVSVALIDNVFSEKEINAIISAANTHPKLKNIPDRAIKDLIREQSAVLNQDFKGAIESLSYLIQNHEERLEAVEMMRMVADSDFDVSPEEDQLIIEVMEVLNII
jgi:tellurite resistance protein/pimeloyl-ACP methyl ester carboxylesterase